MLKPLALSLLLSLTAHAAPAPSPSPIPGYGDVDVAAQCPELKLTQQQIEQINTLKVAMVAKLKAQKTALKEAKKTLLQQLGDANVAQDAVQKQEEAVKAGVASLLDTVFEGTNHMVFTILTKEQRQPGVACFQKVTKEMRKKWLQRKCAARPGETEESETEIDTL